MNTYFEQDPEVCESQPVPQSVMKVQLAWHARSYCQPADLNKSGPAQLRPWQVPFSANCGLKGVACPDTWLRDRDLHCG